MDTNYLVLTDPDDTDLAKTERLPSPASCRSSAARSRPSSFAKPMALTRSASTRRAARSPERVPARRSPSSKTASTPPSKPIWRRSTQYFNIPNPPSFQVINQSGATDNTDIVGEASLDVEWAHAIAPDASIIVYDADNNAGNSIATPVERDAHGVAACRACRSSR